MAGPVLGVNHVGYVVSDLDLAGRFFVDVLGFEPVVERTGALGDPDAGGDLMTRRFGVHPRATGTYVFYRAGDALVELLAWQSPDQESGPPRNCDAGGRHLAVSVADVEAAKTLIAAFPGTKIREPNDTGYIYVTTPFGLEVQLIPVQGGAR